MNIFKAEQARASVAEYNAERERITQKRAEEIAEQVFEEIRAKSAKGAQGTMYSITEHDIKVKVMVMLVDAGYDVREDYSRVFINWGE